MSQSAAISGSLDAPTGTGEMAVMADTKPELWEVSMGYEDQEDTKLWKERATGGLKSNQRYIDTALRRRSDEMERRWSDADGIGAEICTTAGWHHNGANKKAVHKLWCENEPEYVFVDLRKFSKQEQRVNSSSDSETYQVTR